MLKSIKTVIKAIPKYAIVSFALASTSNVIVKYVEKFQHKKQGMVPLEMVQ